MSLNKFSWSKSTKTTFSSQKPFLGGQNQQKPVLSVQIDQNPCFRSKPHFSVKIDPNHFFWPKSTRITFSSQTSFSGQNQPKPVFVWSKSTKPRFWVQSRVCSVKINQNHSFWAKIDQNVGSEKTQYFRPKSTKTIQNPPPSARS